MDNLETDLDINTTKDQVKTHVSVDNWQRLAPIAMLYFFIKFLQVLIGNIFIFIPAIIFGYKHIMENPWLWGPAFLIGIALISLSVFLSFYFFKYRLANDHIEIRSGVFAKKHINLPFTRIQNIKLEQPIYYRPFDYTCLQLDTAGSAKQEANVVALKVSFAEALKKEILATHNTTTTSIDDTELTSETHNENDEVILNTRSLNDLIIHGLTNNRVWIFLGGLAPFFDNIGRAVVEFFNDFGIDIEQLLTIADKSWWQISMWALTLTFLILLPITLFSIAGSILSFYNYTLSKVDDRYIRRSGLLTKHEVTMKLPRLQMVVRQQDWLDLLLKRINLTFEQNNSIGNQPGAHNNKIIVPSISPSECQTLIDDVFPSNNMENLSYTGISKRFLLRYIGYSLFPIYLIIASIAFYADKSAVLIWATPAFIVLSFLVYCRWYRWGYSADNHFIYVRKGVLGVDYYCFPIYKVQQTQFKQSLFLKKRKLCSIEFVLASGAIKIPYINEKSGYQLINNTLYEVEESARSWM